MKLMKRTIAVIPALLSGVTWAHPGHDEANTVHWHAFDAWGWALALAVAAAAAWWVRRK